MASWRGLAAILERLGAVLVAIGRTTKNIEKPLVFQGFWGVRGVLGESGSGLGAILGRLEAVLSRLETIFEAS